MLVWIDHLQCTDPFLIRADGLLASSVNKVTKLTDKMRVSRGINLTAMNKVLINSNGQL